MKNLDDLIRAASGTVAVLGLAYAIWQMPLISLVAFYCSFRLAKEVA